MSNEQMPDAGHFQFRDLHRNTFIGTASDRYAGWIGQIYSKDRYTDKISSRVKKVGGKSFKEEVLPVESVEEYFTHFSILELDFTFYRVLMDKDLKPTQNYHILSSYRKHLGKTDHIVLKVPQAICARKLWRGREFTDNPDYLDSEIFTRQFYEPAVDLLGDCIKAFLFEQEYQTKKDRISSEEHATTLDQFFGKIPKDQRYHVETRTASLLSDQYFEVLEKHGIGQVLSHWTWLPPLLKQFDRSNRRFINAGNQALMRLVTPMKMRYDETYAKAHPFDRMIDGMMSSQMVEEAVDVMLAAVQQDVGINVIINNRAGGNAPVIAGKIKEAFLSRFRD